jgi:hypothetical protein
LSSGLTNHPISQLDGLEMVVVRDQDFAASR